VNKNQGDLNALLEKLLTHFLAFDLQRVSVPLFLVIIRLLIGCLSLRLPFKRDDIIDVEGVSLLLRVNKAKYRIRSERP
jgi:hypothetical protein